MRNIPQFKGGVTFIHDLEKDIVLSLFIFDSSATFIFKFTILLKVVSASKKDSLKFLIS